MPPSRSARAALIGSFAALALVAPALAQDATPAVDNLAPDATPAAAGPPLPPGVSSVAAGLDNPRGLAIGPDGALYVAESGTAGDGPCIEGPEGDTECYGSTGGISRIDVATGATERIVEGLRSRAAVDGSQATGPHDVAFQGDQVFTVVGLGANPNARVDLDEDGGDLGRLVSVADGSATIVADIAGYERETNPDGGDPDSNPYSFVALDDGGFVVADAGANALFQVGADGAISTLAVFPVRPTLGPGGQEIPMQAVPNAVAIGPDGDYYVGQLTGFPFPAGGANVYRVPAGGGEPEVVAGGFTNIIDVTFGPDGSLYVLQFNRNGLASVDPTDPTTLEGVLYRVAPDGTRTEIAGPGLIAPTSVLVADDGTIYLSIFGVLPGAGQVVALDPGAADAGIPVPATPAAEATPVA